MSLTHPLEFFPPTFVISPVAPGTSKAARERSGIFAPVDSDFSVHIEDAVLPLFSVSELVVSELKDIPDLPPGHAPLQQLVQLRSISGSGPIAVRAGQVLLATITFTAPASPDRDTFTATAVITGGRLPDPVKIPITAFMAAVRVDLVDKAINIVQGQSAGARVSVRSLAGGDTTVRFFLGGPGFTAFGISMDPVSVSVKEGRRFLSTYTITPVKAQRLAPI
jgi:hypothetical protein